MSVSFENWIQIGKQKEGNADVIVNEPKHPCLEHGLFANFTWPSLLDSQHLSFTLLDLCLMGFLFCFVLFCFVLWGFGQY
jgi:hypothetical protein